MHFWLVIHVRDILKKQVEELFSSVCSTGWHMKLQQIPGQDLALHALGTMVMFLP